MRSRVSLLCIVMGSLLFAGCLGGGTAREKEPESAVSASALRPGQGLEYALRTGTGTVFTFGAAALPLGDGWLVASDDPLIAAFEAAFDVFPLGRFDGGDFETPRGAGPMPLYRFPLSDGTTWSAHDGTDALTFVARWDPAIATPEGTEAGFEVQGRDEAGALRYGYDLLVGTGWMSKFVRFVGAPGGETELYRYDVGRASPPPVVMEQRIVEHVAVRHVVDAAGQQLDPSPVATFTVHDAESVFLWLTSTVQNGLQDVRVEDPDGRTYTVQAVGLGAAAASGSVLAPAVAGTWRVTALGGAAAGHASVDAWQMRSEVWPVPPPADQPA